MSGGRREQRQHRGVPVARGPLRARARFPHQPEDAGREAGGDDRPSPPRRRVRSTHAACSRDQGTDLEQTYEFIASDIFAELKLQPHTYGNGWSILNQMGVVLLEDFKERLKEISLDATVLDRLTLSRDPDAASGSCSDSEVFRRHSKDRPKPNSIKKKRKQMQDGRHGESMQSKKKRKLSERR